MNELYVVLSSSSPKLSANVFETEFRDRQLSRVLNQVAAPAPASRSAGAGVGLRSLAEKSEVGDSLSLSKPAQGSVSLRASLPQHPPQSEHSSRPWLTRGTLLAAHCFICAPDA